MLLPNTDLKLAQWATLAIIFIALISFACCFYLTFYDPLTASQNVFFQLAASTFKTCLYGLLTLAGIKNIQNWMRRA